MNLPDWGFSKRDSYKHGSPERGSLMLELVLGIIIVAGLTLFTGQILARYHETKREEASALYLEKLAEAAASYAGSAAFQNAINLGHLDSDDPSLTPFPAVDIATLKSEGYLPSSFPATDAYGGAPRVLYQEGMVQKTGATEKGYLLNTIALLDHPAAMGRARAMRILTQITPQKTNGALRAHFSNNKLYGASGMQIEGAEAASLRGTTTAPTSLVLMRASPIKGGASGTPLDITVQPLDVSSYAVALGTAIEEMAKEYEDRIKAKLRFDWNRMNTQAQMALSPERIFNGAPEWDIPPHACPEGFAPETALYDKTRVRGLHYSDANMGDERGDETTKLADTIKIRLPDGTTKTMTNHWQNDRATIRRKIYSGKTRRTMSMTRTLGTEGDRLTLPVTPETQTFNHGRYGYPHSHSHSYERYNTDAQMTEASWDQARRANACLRDRNGPRPTGIVQQNLRSTDAEGWYREGNLRNPIWKFRNHYHYGTSSYVTNSAHECTYVKRNEVTPIRKCNFDREAYYKKYPMRVRLVPPDEE